MKDGFIRVAAASPIIKVADTDYNAEKITESIRLAAAKGVKLITFPELVITGASCYDLLSHQVILRGAEKALGKIMADTAELDILIFVGLPVAMGAKIMSCAAALYMGELLCLIPEAGNLEYSAEMQYCGITVEVSENALFEHSLIPGLKAAVEIGDDISAPISPAMVHAQAGATVIARLSSEPATLYSTEDSVLDMRAMSRRLSCGILLACPGKGESSTDNVFSGFCAAVESGKVLARDESENGICITEFDIDMLIDLRRKKGGFEGGSDYDVFYFGGEDMEETKLSRKISKRPYLPENKTAFAAACRRIFDIQVSGLIKRMEYAGLDHCVVGISGGSDSTLAAMVCAAALKRMALPAENLIAVTMPCFGTSSRTKNNAVKLAECCGADLRVIDISNTVYSHFDDIGHAHDDYSIAYENAQARVRT
ncbi:MAG: NAD(+) synthase, partial [Oscillospiraceae bacterium]|nr:NAD(+) synthase [Oscillospiraceae bacterium]